MLQYEVVPAFETFRRALCSAPRELIEAQDCQALAGPGRIGLEVSKANQAGRLPLCVSRDLERRPTAAHVAFFGGQAGLRAFLRQCAMRGADDQDSAARTATRTWSQPSRAARGAAAAGTRTDDQDLVVATIAGGTRRCGSRDGASPDATFAAPASLLAVDKGSLVVADGLNNALRVIADGGVRTLPAPVSVQAGARVQWMGPRGLSLLPDGSLLVCNAGHNRLVEYNLKTAHALPFAGCGRKGHRDGPASAAEFSSPSAAYVCADGTVLVADTGNHVIRAITGSAGRRVVRTVAGVPGVAGYRDGEAGFALLHSPSGVVAASSEAEVVYVADTGNHVLRCLTPSYLSTLAGQAACGHADGRLERSAFSSPCGLAVNAEGKLLIADAGNNCVRQICFASRSVETVAGGQGPKAWGAADGGAASARLNRPRGVATGAAGEVWIADTGNNSVRLLATAGEVEALAARWAGARGGEAAGGSDGDPCAQHQQHLKEASAACFAAAWLAPASDPPAPCVTDWLKGCPRSGSRAGRSPPCRAGVFEAKLFEREIPAQDGVESLSPLPWRCLGPASVSLRPAESALPRFGCAHLAELVAQPATGPPRRTLVASTRQLSVCETSFVCCVPPPPTSAAAAASTRANGAGTVQVQLGLRFATPDAAAAFIACEGIGLADGGGAGVHRSRSRVQGSSSPSPRQRPRQPQERHAPATPARAPEGDGVGPNTTSTPPPLSGCDTPQTLAARQSEVLVLRSQLGEREAALVRLRAALAQAGRSQAAQAAAMESMRQEHAAAMEELQREHAAERWRWEDALAEARSRGGPDRER